MCAILLAATSIRKVNKFLRTAKPDEEGNLYVLRRERVGTNRRTGLPPGTASPRTRPDEEPQAA